MQFGAWIIVICTATDGSFLSEWLQTYIGSICVVSKNILKIQHPYVWLRNQELMTQMGFVQMYRPIRSASGSSGSRSPRLYLGGELGWK